MTAKLFTAETSTPKFTISSVHPLPKPRQPVYPFAEMNVGDSFEVPLAMRKDGDIGKLQVALAGAAASFSKRYGYAKFATRQIGGRAVRVWRVE